MKTTQTIALVISAQILYTYYDWKKSTPNSTPPYLSPLNLTKWGVVAYLWSR